VAFAQEAGVAVSRDKGEAVPARLELDIGDAAEAQHRLHRERRHVPCACLLCEARRSDCGAEEGAGWCFVVVPEGPRYLPARVSSRVFEVIAVGRPGVIFSLSCQKNITFYSKVNSF
jgi:hypothetical protein